MPRRRFLPSALCLLIVFAVFLYRNENLQESTQARFEQFDTSFSPPDNNSRIDNTLTVAPNELPGYTGWARPEHTDAGRFQIVGDPSPVGTAGEEWVVTVECSSCNPENESWFFLRAYGPAVITGTVQAKGQGRYQMHFLPIDPGIYTVEVVLTFSGVPPVTKFPLHDTQIPNYEGYLLPGFPFFLTVQGNVPPLEAKLPYCALEQLSSTTTHNSKYARWRLIDSIRIQLAAYQQSFQGLGLRFSYDRVDCRVMGVSNTNFQPFDDCCSSLSMPLHIILIGDSVMRLQSIVLNSWMKTMIESGQAKITFYELYGGTLRSERVSGPKLSAIPQEQASMSEQKIVLFNSGLHDIHRLCGDEWKEDRESYLTESELRQSCIDLYRVALDTLVTNVLQIPNVDLFVFQTTTAGWPKYGNYGVAWSPAHGQELPLDSGFVDRFNRIAMDYIAELKSATSQKHRLQTMDGYWISFAKTGQSRNQQKADIGKKLSHPGHEVTNAIVQYFSMMVVQTVCPTVI